MFFNFSSGVLSYNIQPDLFGQPSDLLIQSEDSGKVHSSFAKTNVSSSLIISPFLSLLFVE